MKIDTKEVDQATLREVWSISEFARLHSLDRLEEERLRKLFGDFASRHELLINVQRPSRFR
ncbi:hypothetical protein ACC761_30750 [Rhizobium ruizarguesonis]|uniref:Uncharacterized protein n=1 Tax=Rhizobium ruizarguesonis TaxID=2081791 RepID=A0AB38HTQ5_9HYPH|nr:hypothetical protein ELH40_36160 [Rhizobium ruizarguesonis]